MNYDIPSASPKDPSDVGGVSDRVGVWHSQVLRIAREKSPTKEQLHFTSRMDDILTRIIMRTLISPQISVELPATPSFNSAAMGVGKSIDRMAEIAQFNGTETEQAAYGTLRQSIGKLDMFDQFGRKSALIKLLETNAAFMAGPESRPPALHVNIEDAAMDLCTMLHELLDQNIDLQDAMAHDAKIVEDLTSLDELSRVIEDDSTHI